MDRSGESAGRSQTGRSEEKLFTRDVLEGCEAVNNFVRVRGRRINIGRSFGRRDHGHGE